MDHVDARVAAATHVVDRIDDRVSWSPTAMIDHANCARPDRTGHRVGGHQARNTKVDGWVDEVSVWAPAGRRDRFSNDREMVLHWRERPTGRDIDPGTADTNQFGQLAELGATWSRWGERLLSVRVVYKPFVGRSLEPKAYGIYAGGQSILLGNPSGVTLPLDNARASRSSRRRSVFNTQALPVTNLPFIGGGRSGHQPWRHEVLDSP